MWNVTPFTIDVKLTLWGSSYVSFKLRPHSSRRLNYFVAYSPVYRATWHMRRRTSDPVPFAIAILRHRHVTHALDTCRMMIQSGWITLRDGRGENVARSRLVISLAAKNPRIVLAPRVSAITRLGELRVRHEMSSFSALSTNERQRERERHVGVGKDGQVAGYSIIGRVAWQLQFR